MVEYIRSANSSPETIQNRRLESLYDVCRFFPVRFHAESPCTRRLPFAQMTTQLSARYYVGS
jgi:hypothetical protein